MLTRRVPSCAERPACTRWSGRCSGGLPARRRCRRGGPGRVCRSTGRGCGDAARGRRGEIEGLADSKLLTPASRERVYAEVVDRALAYAVVVIPAEEVDARGLHVCNLAAMRRALASLTTHPEYVLTDGFGVDGLGVPGLAVWKGDRVAACVAAASVLAKVTRDRLMVELDGCSRVRLRRAQGLHHPGALGGAAGARAVPGAPVLVHQCRRGLRPRRPAAARPTARRPRPG
ncbi:hypothetical protein NKG94_25655 [Micromonospora sp. M12]